MAERTDEVWKSSSLADVYLSGVRAAIPFAQEQIDVMLRLIAARDAPVERILDLGCGDGVLSAAILQNYPEAQAVLADFSPTMLRAAQTRVNRFTKPARVLNLDYSLPVWVQQVQGLAPFDAIVSGYSIHHQPDTRKREIYDEIFGLLRSGGIFINIEHVESASNWVQAVNDELFVDHLHRHHASRSRADVASEFYNRPDKAANILAPVESQCTWLRDIGFADVDCYMKVFELAVFGGRRP
jgi:ubiquinone/menaquinone biosynthesis C-methylase UbiE